MRLTESELANLQRKAGYSARAGQSGPATAKARMQAKGRLKAGEMNKTEQAFATHLQSEMAAGRVLWFAFEAIKLRLAPNTTLTVDFFVLSADHSLIAIDVKGSKAIYTDDARVKMKVAADTFPWLFQVAYPKAKKDGGGWLIEDVA